MKKQLQHTGVELKQEKKQNSQVSSQSGAKPGAVWGGS
jgi:hypothetical protein